MVQAREKPAKSLLPEILLVNPARGHLRYKNRRYPGI
jgi:hypothetical protein